jgi:drug/metabolite transporter (DMT)-like permease
MPRDRSIRKAVSIKPLAEARLLTLPQNQNVTQNMWKGIAWKVVACLSFAFLNTLVRYLTGGAGQVGHPLTPLQLTFLQNVVGSLLILPWLWRHGIRALKTDKPFLHGVRIIAGVTGIVTLYYAFQNMPVAQAVSLQFTGPVFTALGAWLYLRERIGLLRITGIFLGLIGAFLITRPDCAFTSTNTFSSTWIMLLPLMSALAFAIAKLTGRQLARQGESAVLLTIYLVVFMVPASMGPALYAWTWPELKQWGYIILLGLFAWAGHFAMAKSYAYAEVLFLVPFDFSRILFSALLAYIAFAEKPVSSAFWIGTMIIMLSTVLITVEEEYINPSKAPNTPP